MTDIVITPGSVVPGTNAVIEHGWAGETLAAGKVVYRADSVDGRYKLADSNVDTSGRNPYAARYRAQRCIGRATRHYPAQRAGDDRRNAGGEYRILSERHARRHLPGRRCRHAGISNGAGHEYVNDRPQCRHPDIRRRDPVSAGRPIAQAGALPACQPVARHRRRLCRYLGRGSGAVGRVLPTARRLR